MRIAYRYNHLHAEEYLYYRKKSLIDELERCIRNIDANKYLKISCDKSHLGEVYYDQKALNEEIEKDLNLKGWNELKISYYVTEDENVTKQIVKVTDKEEQKRIIEQNGLTALASQNQVDFMKDRIAVEVQFGKYFSVAYDLHVKHTFFYLRDDIEVGIEIIPTHKMMLCMDTGVAWFENEVTNVIREGRNNPSVPVYILGIESDEAISTDPCDYTDSELREIVKHSDVSKLKTQIEKTKNVEEEKWNKKIKVQEEKVAIITAEMDALNKEYLHLDAEGKLDKKTADKLIGKNEKLLDKQSKERDRLFEIKNSPSGKLEKIYRIERIL